MIIGYTTGTFDMIHKGHIMALRFMKQYCDSLIVALTTDDLATKQKRTPIMSFSHRKDILFNFPEVDFVVENTGQDKLLVQKQLNINVFFIGNEYIGDKEYMELDRKGIEVIYVPRNEISTTRTLIKMNPTIFALGIYGPLYIQNNIIMKPVNVGVTEVGTTADVYNMPLPRLRNWKRPGEVHIHPNITGVNSNRELRIHEFIKDEAWNPVVEVTLEFKNDNAVGGTLDKENQFPAQIWHISQKHGGQTLMNWLKTNKIEDILDDLKTICNRLVELRIIHGDLHSNNICISERGVISIIDFGWCQHESFNMNVEEMEQYENRLKNGWDWKHLLDSLEWDKESE